LSWASSVPAPRHRGVEYEPFFRDSVVLACPPGHRFAGRTVTIDELRGETLVVMQDCAGVRQMIEDELRSLGTRLRDLDVHLELGLQESVTTAVRIGYGVTFISRSSVESDLVAGTLVEARVADVELEREIFLVRATRPLGERRGARVRRVREGTPPLTFCWGKVDQSPASSRRGLSWRIARRCSSLNSSRSSCRRRSAT